MTTFKINNAIRLRATFKTWVGVVADLVSNPTLKIYHTDYEINHTLLETIAPASITHTSTGIYDYYYVPTHYGEHTFEYSGTSEGTTVLERAKFVVSFDEV